MRKSSKLIFTVLTALSSALVVTHAQSAFTKVTVGAIVNDGGGSFGCAWGDYDGDGFPDLYVANALDGGTNFLYHNNRDGTFTRVTSGGPATLTGQFHGCAWGDFNDDGRPDLIVIRTEDNAVQAHLFRNDGSSGFTLLASSTLAGLFPNSGGHCQAALWADYDNDGFLDVFFNRWGDDWLYHNSGTGNLARATSVVAGKESQDGFSAAWQDYDNDGLPDLVVTVTSDPPSRRLYHNLGGGKFEQVTTGDLVTDGGHSAGLGWADYDNDGFADLFVANGDSDGRNFLYHNNHDGTFTRVSSAIAGSIASDLGGYDQCTWGDYDNDGYIDLFVTAASALGGSPVGNVLYHNNGDGSFTRVLHSPTGEVANSVGCAWADYDNDGFLDLFVANGGVVEDENNSLYHNNRNGNNWLKVRCVGSVSNRSAIGAKVRVKATIRGQTFWQLREINTGSGFCQSPLEAHFGLGDATNALTVRLEWPSGTVQELENVPAKQMLTITEPPRLKSLGTAVAGSFQLALSGGLNFAYDLQRSTDLMQWVTWANVTNTSRVITLSDTNTVGAGQHFYRAVLR